MDPSRARSLAQILRYFKFVSGSVQAVDFEYVNCHKGNSTTYTLEVIVIHMESKEQATWMF